MVEVGHCGERFWFCCIGCDFGVVVLCFFFGTTRDIGSVYFGLRAVGRTGMDVIVGVDYGWGFCVVVAVLVNWQPGVGCFGNGQCVCWCCCVVDYWCVDLG